MKVEEIFNNSNNNDGIYEKTKSLWNTKFSSLFSKSKIDESFWDELEESLVTSDVNVSFTFELIEFLKSYSLSNNINEPQIIIDLIKEKAQITTDNNNEKIVYLSAKTGDGLDLLKQVILNLIGFDNNEGNQNKFMARKRHLEALEKVYQSLKNAESNIDSAELVAEELTISQRYLSSITGEFSSDDLLGEIFSKFCIGK